MVCLLLCAAALACPAASNVFISEFMAANNGSLLDADQDASDWIELYNAGSDTVNLHGWHLTDTTNNLALWTLPSTNLAAGKHLVIFASGKDRAVAGAELHTNFKLDSAGEYLALVEPGGATIAQEFAPAYPPQFDGVSYGLSITVSNFTLITNGTTANWKVPASTADYPTNWMDVGFDDSAWSLGKTGLGFDRTPVSTDSANTTNLALGKGAWQSSTLGSFYASYGVDGNYGNFTHTVAGANTPATWLLWLGTNYSLSRIVLWNRTSCCGSRLRDITVSVLSSDGTTTNFVSTLLNPENTLDAPPSLTVDLVALTGGPVVGGRVQVTRTPDPDLSGTNGEGNSDEPDVLSLGEVEVFGQTIAARAGDWIATDIAASPWPTNATLLARSPFVLRESALPASGRLALRIRYNDGFVAFLNGTEVARRNAPDALAWNATAAAALTNATAVEEISLPNAWTLLQEGQNVLAIQGLNAADADPNLLLLPELVAISTQISPARYFTTPTPGAANATGWLGLVDAPQFSTDSGLLEALTTVSLSTMTPGAEIRYTTNGTAPEAYSGLLYSGPITVDRTLTLRAAAFLAGWAPSSVETRTYVLLSSVASQSQSAAVSAGYPAKWGGVTADYGMDASIAASRSNDISNALRTLPSVFITASIPSLFDTYEGIYANPDSHSVDWERPATIEWVGTNQTSEFRVDCGLRVQGGYFRNANVTRKHSLRVLFKEQYGVPKLRHRIFADRSAASVFDTLVFRAGANDGYSWADAGTTVQFIRDEFGRRTQLAMGGAAPHGDFVHLYLNGLYWGLYNLAERPNEDFSATYFGGDAATWDSINAGDLKNGSFEAWDKFYSAVSQPPTVTSYRKLQGLAADGTRNSSYPVYLDRTNYIDYMILNIWGGNWDWPNKNFWIGRDQTTNSTGFKFYTWDFENTMGNNRGRSPLYMVAPRADIASSWVGYPHYCLQNFREYQLDFADRVQRWFFHDGAIAPAALIARYRALADQVEAAVLAESARWGNDTTTTPRTQAQWRTERDWILNTYLPQRTAIVLGQFKSAGLYPTVAAPEFSQYGGSLPAAYELTLTHSNASGVIYYTTNGADPRVYGTGAVADSAQPYQTPLNLTVPTHLRARVLNGSTWSALEEATFYPAQDLTRLVLSELMYHAPDWGATNGNNFDFIELKNIGPNTLSLDGCKFTNGVSFEFTNGTRIAAGQPFLLAHDAAAMQAKYPGVTVSGIFTGNLDNGGETLTLVDALGTVIFSFAYNDKAPWPTTADGAGYSLVLKNPAASPNLNEGANWAASVAIGGTPGADEIASPAIESFELVRTPSLALRLRFTAVAGRAYSIEYCDDLAQGQWQTGDTVAAGETTHAVEIDAPLAAATAGRYYRIACRINGSN